MWVAVPISIVFLIVALYFFNIYWKRRKFTSECESKVKFYMLPRSGGFPAIKLMSMKIKANIVTVDWLDENGKKDSVYTFEQADTFNDWWPDNEKRKFQVQVPAVVWREGDPTPLTTTRQYVLRDNKGYIVTEKSKYISECMELGNEPNLEYAEQLSDKPVMLVDPPLNAASALVIANEEELTASAGDDQLDTMSKQINDLHKGAQFMLNKPLVYGGLMIIIIMLIAVTVLSATPDSMSPEVMAKFDNLAKMIQDVKNGMGLGN